MTKYQKRMERYKRIHSNPKIGKLVVNRQHTYYGFLASNGKINHILAAKSLENLSWSHPPGTIRIGHLRIL